MRRAFLLNTDHFHMRSIRTSHM